MRICARLGAISLALTLFSACGGGSAPALPTEEPPPNLETTVLPTIAQATGYVSQPAHLAAPATPAVGDNEIDRPQRGFFRFDLTLLPPGIEIESAELQVYQRAVQGDPYGALGPLFVGDVNLGVALDTEDYGSLVLSSAIGVLASDGDFDLKILDVTEKVRRDHTFGRLASDFRLFYNIATDLDGEADRAFLEAGAGGPTSGLVVTYRR